MSKLRIASVNICGLNDPKKRRNTAIGLRLLKADVICLQETHIENSQRHLLGTLGYVLVGATKQNSRTRGVAILASNHSLQFSRVSADQQGRWVITECSWNNGNPMTICSIYGSNVDDPTVIYQVSNELATWPLPLILCGDFNINLPADKNFNQDTGWVYKGRKPKVFSALKALCQEHTLTDLWNWQDPTKSGFTYYSYPHNKHVRIDYILVSHSLLHNCKMEKNPRILADHNPLIAEVKWGQHRGRTIPIWTFERALLLDGEYCAYMRGWIPQFVRENVGSAGIEVVWDTLKAGVRGETLRYSIQRNKKRQKTLNDQLVKLAIAEEELITIVQNRGNHEEAQAKVAVAKSAAMETLAKKAADKLAVWREEAYECSEQVGHHLAIRARQRATRNFITEIRDPEQGLISESVGIRKTFYSYYQKLYNEDAIQNMADIATYLNQIPTEQLPEEEQQQLEEPPQWLETLLCINSLPSGKATGMDGIPLEFYQKFSEQLKECMELLVTHVFTGGTPPDSWSHAKIIIFLKKNKNPTDPGSYRPITLINADSKIYSKILATRIASVIHMVISNQQHGFIPGRGTTDHVRRVITLLDTKNISKEPIALILLDAEKAFDRVSWTFLWETLSRVGIGSGLLQALKMLYHKPTARVLVNNELTDSFQVTRGTRQGCPSSPLLFAIYIDPFLRQLERNNIIRPIITHGWETKVLAYADDVALVTPCLEMALREIEVEAAKFGKISGYSLNRSKTQIICNENVTYIDERIVQKATYLGIDIIANTDYIVKENIEPLVLKIKPELIRLHNLHLSIIGRCNIIKMLFFS